MRSSARRLIACLAGALLAPAVAAADGLLLRYAGNPDYPPYHWCEGQQLLVGASVAQLQQVMPARVRLLAQVYPWKRVLLAAEQGVLDVVLPLRINPQRARYLRFSRYPAFENPIVVFVRKDKPIVYQGWDSLKPYRGGVSLGDVFGSGFDEYLASTLRIDVAPDMASNFKKLALGRIDYFITGRYVGQAYLRKASLSGVITDLPQAVSVSKIHLGFGKNVPDDIIAEVDAGLKKMADSGASAALLQKWVDYYASSGTGSRGRCF